MATQSTANRWRINTSDFIVYLEWWVEFICTVSNRADHLCCDEVEQSRIFPIGDKRRLGQQHVSLDGKARRPARGVEANRDRCDREPGPKLPGQRSRCDSRLADSGGVTLDHVGGTRRQANRLSGKTSDRVAFVLRRARYHLARSDPRRTQFIVHMTAAMAASNVKYRSGFLNANVSGQAVRAERREVGPSAMRTMKCFHISSLLFQHATKPLFSSLERNFGLKSRLTLFLACSQCLGEMLPEMH